MTQLEQFDKWLNLLPWEPWLIPILKHDKKPDVPEGESWKDGKYRLTVEQARKRMEQGLNVGVAATGHDFVFFDFDDPEKFMLEKETLTIQTRNGKIHKHYLNGGDVKNADGKGKYKGCGEVRAEWKYVLAPGSYVKPDDNARPGATGLYKIVDAKTPAPLHAEDLPPEFQPSLTKNEQKEKPKTVMAGSFRNQYGWSIEDICRRDGKLDSLLRSHNLSYASPSEADMACLSKLLFWGYTEDEAVDILKYFRGRQKLDRKDYVEMTLSKVSHGETICNYVDAQKWNPTTGYDVPFESEEPNEEAGNKTSLVFHVVSKHEIKVKAVKEGKAVSGWVTVQSPEKLRTSRNAKVLRQMLKTDYPEDHGVKLEKTIERIEKAVVNWKPKTQEKSQDKEEKPKFSEDVQGSIEIEVARIIEAPNQLEALEKHLNEVLVGEEATKKAIFALASSGKYPEPEKKQMILLKGEAGGGKTTVQNGATVGLKTKVVGRFTQHALDYADLEGFEVLMLKEIGKMDEEQQGLSTLKFLSSDDKGYTVEMPIRDQETGRFKNTIYKIPPITVISSTTRLTLDSQFERRTWLFNVDETEEQTKKVALWKAKRRRQEYEKKLGYRKYTDYEFSKEVVERFVKQFKPLSVVIPFPKALTEFLGYDVLRVRGDIDKVYSFLEFYGAYNKKRLEEMQGPNGKAYALTPEICVEALKIILNPLTNMLSRMDERAKLILNALTQIEDVVKEHIDGEQESFEKLVKYDRVGTEIDKKLRGRIAVKIGKSDNTVRKFLSFLESSGFVSSTGGKGRTPKTFTLLYGVEQIKKRLLGLSFKLETPDNLLSEMRKEAQKWRESLLNAQTPRSGFNYNETTMPNIPETQINNTHRGESAFNKEPSVTTPSLVKTSEDSRVNLKRTLSPTNDGVTPHLLRMENLKRKGAEVTNRKNNQVMYVCEICEKCKKDMFFATKHDLNIHVERVHGKTPPYVS